MYLYKLFRAYKNNPLFLAVALIIGMMLAVGGSVLATSIGESISVTNQLTVTGSTGLGSSTPGSILSIQGVANFASATSTLYADLRLRSLTATSSVYFADGSAEVPSLAFTSDSDTGLFWVSGNILGFTTSGSQRAQFTNSGSLGVGTTSPGGFFSLSTASSSPGFLIEYTGTGHALYVEDVADDTSPFVVDESGNVGVGTSTPGSVFAVQNAANFVVGATSTVYSGLRVPNFTATSTIATSTISTGGFQVGQAGALAAFTVNQSATTSVGVGTSTPTSHQFAVGGNALFGAGANGTSTVTISSSGTNIGGCIELRATDGTILRIYATSSPSAAQAYTNAGGGGGYEKLVVEAGACR